jgi:uncharacterized membrane protein
MLFLEIVIVRCFGLQFNIDYRVTFLEVLWALGWAMIALAALVRAPTVVSLLFGTALVAGHNLLDGLPIAHPLWAILHSPGFVLNTPEHVVFAAYPLIPWIGVTALGYALGQVYEMSPGQRRTWLVRLGFACIAAFLSIRLANAYGDPFPWSVQRSPTYTVLSFLNANKYPPSLLFLLMTLGPALLLLRAWDTGTPRLLRPAVVVGRVPLFFFLIHFPLIHLLAVGVAYARYGTAHWFFESPGIDKYPFTPPPEWGYALPVIYLTWVIVVIVLFPACRWFAGIKARSHAHWLSYL